MKKLVILAAAGGLMLSGAAFAGKSPAPNQSQPTSSVVTTASVTSAITNAIDAGLTVTGPSGAGAVKVTVQASVGGSTVAVPATVSLSSGGVVTVSFADGSSINFSAADFS